MHLGQMKFAGVAALLLVAGIASANQNMLQVNLDSAPYSGYWQVVYDGRQYDAQSNTTTFSYTVTVNNVSGSKDLSHLVLGFETACDMLPVFVSYWPVDAVEIRLVDPDPTTGLVGIKWDGGQLKSTSQTYSFTLQGNVSEGPVEVGVKAGTYSAVGVRLGPACETVAPPQTYAISGVAFVDANRNGTLQADEPLLGNVTVDLYDADGNLVASSLTNPSGAYIFSDLPEGAYSVSVAGSTQDAHDFNETLATYFDATTPASIAVNLSGADSTGNNFGFAPDTTSISDDLNPGDPDGDLFSFAGTGKTIGFWKHQLSVAMNGKGRAQVDAVSLQGYLVTVQGLYLAQPYQFPNGYADAFNVLKSTSSAPSDLLKKQLLGTEFNEVSGLGLSGSGDALQTDLVAWGEFLAANSGAYTNAELLAAKNIFDAINNTGE